MSDKTVTSLKPIDAEPDMLVVEAIEVMLEEAKSGALRSVVMVGDLRGGDVIRAVGMSDRIKLMGFLHYAMAAVQDAS